MKLILPAKGVLQPNDEHDPLPYYYHPLVGWLFRKRLRMALALLPAGGRRILDVGVGSGILVPTLSAQFSEYCGSDLVLAQGLDQLVARPCRAEFIKADLLEDGALAEASFDVIVCLSVLEHITDADRAAAALAKALVKGGTLVAGYPMVNRFMAKLFRLIGFGAIDDHHVTTPATIDKALRKVLRPIRRKAIPPLAPVSISLYQCTAWVKE
jgi:SAM-dependent methyltransferase